MLMSVIILLVLFIVVARSYKKNSMAPKGLAGFLEPLVIFVRDDIAIPNIGENPEKRILIAINQADVAMKGKYWNEKENKPVDFQI